MLMAAWCEAIMRHVEFRQQMDPLTGEFTQADPSGYSPAALVFLEFARRLGHARRIDLPMSRVTVREAGFCALRCAQVEMTRRMRRTDRSVHSFRASGLLPCSKRCNCRMLAALSEYFQEQDAIAYADEACGSAASGCVGTQLRWRRERSLRLRTLRRARRTRWLAAIRQRAGRRRFRRCWFR